jgi:hypothetical protein
VRTGGSRQPTATSGFSMERLFRFLIALGMDVEIVVKPAP